jgi:hypothetical protein
MNFDNITSTLQLDVDIDVDVYVDVDVDVDYINVKIEAIIYKFKLKLKLKLNLKQIHSYLDNSLLKVPYQNLKWVHASIVSQSGVCVLYVLLHSHSKKLVKAILNSHSE